MKKKYVKEYLPTENGKLKYLGKYYHSQIQEKERKKQSILQIIYGTGCLLLVLTGLCIPCQGNRTFYIVIPLELTLICLWGYLTGSFALYKMQDKMEQKDYDKVYQGPIQSLTIAILFYVVSFCGQVIGIMANDGKRSSGDAYFFMILAVILLISIAMWHQQRKIIQYVTEEKTKKDNEKESR